MIHQMLLPQEMFVDDALVNTFRYSTAAAALLYSTLLLNSGAT